MYRLVVYHGFVSSSLIGRSRNKAPDRQGCPYARLEVLVSVGVVPRLMTMFECDSIPRFVEVAGRW